MLVATIVCSYVALIQNNMGSRYHIVVSALLFSFARRLAVVRLSCNMPLRDVDETRVLSWSAPYIVYLAIRGSITAAIHKQCVRTTMEGIIGSFFLFVSMKGLGTFMENMNLSM